MCIIAGEFIVYTLVTPADCNNSDENSLSVDINTLSLVVKQLTFLCVFFISQGFKSIYRQFFPLGDPSDFATIVFNSFDENQVA